MGDHVKNGASVGLLAGWIIDRHILDAHNASFAPSPTYSTHETTAYTHSKKELDKNSVATWHIVEPFLPQKETAQQSRWYQSFEYTHLDFFSKQSTIMSYWSDNSQQINDYSGHKYGCYYSEAIFRQ